MEFSMLLNKKRGYNNRYNYALEIVFSKFLPKKIQKIDFFQKIDKRSWLFFLNNLDCTLLDKNTGDFDLEKVKEKVLAIDNSINKYSKNTFDFQDYYYTKNNLIKFFRNINFKHTKKYLKNLENYGKIEVDNADKHVKIKDIDSMNFDYQINLKNLKSKRINMDNIEMIIHV